MLENRGPSTSTSTSSAAHLASVGTHRMHRNRALGRIVLLALCGLPTTVRARSGGGGGAKQSTKNQHMTENTVVVHVASTAIISELRARERERERETRPRMRAAVEDGRAWGGRTEKRNL